MLTIDQHLVEHGLVLEPNPFRSLCHGFNPKFVQHSNIARGTCGPSAEPEGGDRGVGASLPRSGVPEFTVDIDAHCAGSPVFGEGPVIPTTFEEIGGGKFVDAVVIAKGIPIDV